MPAPILVSEPAPASAWLMLNVFAAATISNVPPFAPYAIVFGREFSVVPVTCNVPPLIFSASFASAAVESESVPPVRRLTFGDVSTAPAPSTIVPADTVVSRVTAPAPVSVQVPPLPLVCVRCPKFWNCGSDIVPVPAPSRASVLLADTPALLVAAVSTTTLPAKVAPVWSVRVCTPDRNVIALARVTPSPFRPPLIAPLVVIVPSPSI